MADKSRHSDCFPARRRGFCRASQLGMAYRIAALLREKDSAAVVQAWFQGMNPRLDDVAPARLLRKGDLEQVGPGVLAAARALAMAG